MTRQTKEAAALAQLPQAPAGRIYVAVGPFCWGKAETAAAAVAHAKKNRARSYEGTAGWRYLLYEAPDTTTINEIDGSLEWTWPRDQDTPPAPAQVVYRHRMPPHERHQEGHQPYRPRHA